MKIVVLRENLDAALATVQKGIPSKPALPILSSIYLVVKKHECELSSTDLYFGVTVVVQAQADEEGIFTVPGKQFRDIISSLPQGKLTLEYTEGTLKIVSEKTKSSLQCQSSEEYPQFPEITAEPFTFTSQQLEMVDRFVGFAASSDLARPVLTTILCSLEPEQQRFVATDGFRLAVYTASQPMSVLSSTPLLIPAKALSEVLRSLKQSGEQQVGISVSQELKQVLFVLGDTRMYVRLIDGEFPPYEKIIPTSFTTKATFVKQELEANIKRALVFARESSNIIKLSISPTQVLISATSSSLGMFEGEVVGSVVEGPEATIAFNARYILEYLQALPGEVVQFAMTESLKPALFSSLEVTGHQYIVMPFKVNS